MALCSARFKSRKMRALLDCAKRRLPVPIIVVTLIVRITFDAVKRAETLEQRGLDFLDAQKVFTGVTVEFEDLRQDYGETRMICFGHLRGRLVVIVYAPRDAGRHIISMRKANAREKARLAPLFGI